jgi:hypothetical protein
VGVGGGLLGRHVRGRAEGDAGGSELVFARRLGHRLGDAEVHHHRVAAGEHDVLGLDVAVDYAARVGGRQRLGDLAQEPDRLGHRQLAPAGEPVAEGLALDVGHDVVEEAAGLARVDEPQDVGVLQPGGDGDLAAEALGAEGGGELGAEDLEGDSAVMLQVLGEVDGGHAALPELPLDAVALGEGGLEAGHRVGHVGLWSGCWKMGGVGAAGVGGGGPKTIAMWLRRTH